jgi:hypothetical protein
MGKLGDILGSEFEEDYEEKRNQRRDEANKVDKSTLMEICYKAIEGGGFDGEEPRFRFDAGDIDHDILLMESPDTDLQTFRWPLGDSAKTQGMFHLNQLFSLAFQENMLDLLDKIKVGEYYLVVGRYEETTQSKSDGKEETYYNVNPVRGIVPIEVAQQYSQEYESNMSGTSVEEQSEEQSSSAGDGGGSDSGVDLGGLGEDEPETTDEDIIEVFRVVGDQAPSVLESVASGDEDAMEKLCTVVRTNTDTGVEDERTLDVFEDNVESIPGRHEDEDSDGDGIELDGLEGDSSGPSDSNTEADTDPASDSPTEDTDTEVSDTDSDGESDVEEWF